MKQRAESHYEANSVTHLAQKKIWWSRDCPYGVNPYIRQCANLEAFIVLFSFRKLRLTLKWKEETTNNV